MTRLKLLLHQSWSSDHDSEPEQLLQSWSSFMGLELSYPSSDLYPTLSSWTTQTQQFKLSQIFVSTWRTSPMKFQTSCMHWRNCRCICWPKLRPISAQVLLSAHPKTKTKQKKTPIFLIISWRELA